MKRRFKSTNVTIVMLVICMIVVSVFLSPVVSANSLAYIDYDFSNPEVYGELGVTVKDGWFSSGNKPGCYVELGDFPGEGPAAKLVSVSNVGDNNNLAKLTAPQNHLPDVDYSDVRCVEVKFKMNSYSEDYIPTLASKAFSVSYDLGNETCNLSFPKLESPYTKTVAYLAADEVHTVKYIIKGWAPEQYIVAIYVNGEKITKFADNSDFPLEGMKTTSEIAPGYSTSASAALNFDLRNRNTTGEGDPAIAYIYDAKYYGIPVRYDDVTFYKGDDVIETIQSGDIKCSITLRSNIGDQESKVIAALYKIDDGEFQLKDTDIWDAPLDYGYDVTVEPMVTVPEKEGNEEYIIKVFTWNNTDGMVPLLQSKTFDDNGFNGSYYE